MMYPGIFSGEDIYMAFSQICIIDVFTPADLPASANNPGNLFSRGLGAFLRKKRPA